MILRRTTLISPHAPDEIRRRLRRQTRLPLSVLQLIRGIDDRETVPNPFFEGEIDAGRFRIWRRESDSFRTVRLWVFGECADLGTCSRVDVVFRLSWPATVFLSFFLVLSLYAFVKHGASVSAAFQSGGSLALFGVFASQAVFQIRPARRVLSSLIDASIEAGGSIDSISRKR